MKRERVWKAMKHQEPDRVPRGELLIAPALIEQLCPEPGLAPLERKKAALAIMNMDFVTVNPAPPPVKQSADGRCFDSWGREVVSMQGHWVTVTPPLGTLEDVSGYAFPDPEVFSVQEIEYWAKETDFFVFALLDGIFQSTAGLMEFNEFLVATVTKQEELTELAEAYGEFLHALACCCLEAGAHGLIIGDDMAATNGPIISPKALEKIFFPVYRRLLGDLKRREIPVILHCDGNINLLLPYFAGLGFTGVHSLEPAAGMDLAAIKQQYGRDLCLMGNIDPSLLEQDNLELVKKVVRETLQIGSPGGGFILSTASGSLTEGMNPEAVLVMYRT